MKQPLKLSRFFLPANFKPIKGRFDNMIATHNATAIGKPETDFASLTHRKVRRAAVRVIAAVIGMTLLTANAPLLRAASAAQNREVNVFAAADDGSSVVESVRDGSALVPIGEMTGAGGMKGFMGKTKSGNGGRIKAADNPEVKRIDDHFHALPKDSVMGVPSTAGGSETTIAPE